MELETPEKDASKTWVAKKLFDKDIKATYKIMNLPKQYRKEFRFKMADIMQRMDGRHELEKPLFDPIEYTFLYNSALNYVLNEKKFRKYDHSPKPPMYF